MVPRPNAILNRGTDATDATQCRIRQGEFYALRSARNFSASIAAMQPEPAAVIAWR
jgi:hypothetical protein